MTYTSRTNVENYLRTTFTESTTPSITTVDDWVTDVDTEINNLTGTSWSITSATQYFDLNVPTDRFITEKFPLVSVTSIKYNDYSNADGEFNPNWVAFDNNRVVGDVVKTDLAVEGQNKVELAYTYGHSTVPPEVEHLATLLVSQKIVSSDDAANADAESVSIGPISLRTNIGQARFINLNSAVDDYNEE